MNSSVVLKMNPTKSKLNSELAPDSVEQELIALRRQLSTLYQKMTEIEIEKADLELLLEVHTNHSDNVADELLTQVEDTLRESAKRFRLIAEATPVPVVISHFTDGIIVYANRLAALLVNSPLDQILGRNALDFFYNPQQRQGLLDTLAQQGYVKDHEIQLRNVDGTILWVSASIQPLTFDGVPCLLSAFYDLTERKQAEEERARFAAMQQELDFAHRIQVSLLPASRPEWPALDVVCYSSPARDVGGDFYTYHAFGDTAKLSATGQADHYGIAVGDVSGKGMPAALLMAVSFASLEAIIDRPFSPGELLAYLDQAIAPHTKKIKQNCALCYIDITPPSLSLGGGKKGRIMRVANAGCVEPILRRANGEVQWIEVGGMPLGTGFGASLGYPEETLTLSPGDLVVMSSDGVAEAMIASGEIFGFERLEEAIRSGPNTTAEAMLTYILTQVGAFVGQAEAHDDLTIIVLKV